MTVVAYYARYASQKSSLFFFFFFFLTSTLSLLSNRTCEARNFTTIPFNPNTIHYLIITILDYMLLQLPELVLASPSFEDY